MLQVKINIFKLIKMLAKIKHDEGVFNRPLNPSSAWHKLSRTQVDYRQIAFDRRNRERPGLVDAIDSNFPVFTSIERPDTSGWNTYGGRPKNTYGLSDNSAYYNGRWYVKNYPPLNGSILEWVRKNPDSNQYWEEDISYSWRYDCLNIWWFDLCIAPTRYELLLSEADVQSGQFSGQINRRIILDYNPLRESSNKKLTGNFYEYSPSRDLATNVFLEFASMQNNPQAFLHKMSYITAPYMPFVEQNKIFMAPLSKNVFDLRDPKTRTGLHGNMYGIGDIFSVFLDESPSSLDRIKRQKLFNDYFKKLDSANWVEADKIADRLIQLTDGNGWAPYIGYGDLSLFIQRMNIPNEYIMTHALTDFQDELLTNAYGVHQLNRKISEKVYELQKEIVDLNELINMDATVSTQNGYITNSTPYVLYETIVESSIVLRNALSAHIAVGGSIPDAQSIIENVDNFDEAVDVLSSKATEISIERQLELINKMK